VNKELKRSSGVIGAFSNHNSLLRLAGSLHRDIDKEGIAGRRCLSLSSEITSLITGAEITAEYVHYLF
jgi:hypothetical protein